MLGPQRKSHILSPKEKEITAYHEGGHALVGTVLPYSDPVHKVSVISRGRAAGYTMKLPVEDKHLHTRQSFLDEIAALLGGYAAEKLVFKELTTGASNDMQNATKLARNMVTQWGMSDILGPRTYGERQDMIFLGREIQETRDYSEEKAQLIDKEIDALIRDGLATAKKLIADHRDAMDRICGHLIAKEIIERDEFEAVVGLPPANAKSSIKK